MPHSSAPEIRSNVDLSGLSSFRLPARAAELVVLDSPEQVEALPASDAPELVLGGGTNTLFIGDFPGRIILNRMRGLNFRRDGDSVLVTAAAGENWHALVRRCLDQGLYGIENLAMIPGSVGAAPMQNIGAYGVELSDLFERLTARDRLDDRWVTLERDACHFGYRDSRFKSSDRDRFLITEVTLRLSRTFRPNIGYASLAGELERLKIEQPSARQLAAAVMRLRRHRLPDPARLPNAGSFFKNPVVARTQADELLAEHPELPHWPMPEGRVKLAAGWLIETLGWREQSVGDIGVYRNHALVLVNHGRGSGDELLALIDAVRRSVHEHFGISLEAEPQLVGVPASTDLNADPASTSDPLERRE